MRCTPHDLSDGCVSSDSDREALYRTQLYLTLPAVRIWRMSLVCALIAVSRDCLGCVVDGRARRIGEGLVGFLLATLRRNEQRGSVGKERRA